jgi:NAD(P)-dependent dehydrogenase (short-subunit alcohol dehydrogenase family)
MTTLAQETFLVKGAEGFTGKYVVEEFRQRGHKVFGTSVAPSALDQTFQVDLTDRNQVESVVKEISPTIVVHLAAISFVQHRDLKELYAVNVFGSSNLLTALGELREPRLKQYLLAPARYTLLRAVRFLRKVKFYQIPITRRASSRWKHSPCAGQINSTSQLRDRSITRV